MYAVVIKSIKLMSLFSLVNLLQLIIFYFIKLLHKYIINIINKFEKTDARKDGRTET
jgi:hypothetical protein